MKPRKLILSRKGFDSKFGRCPSPIFPDGTMYSLPIPGDDEDAPIHYSDLQHGDINIGRVVEDLTKGRLVADSLAGLDPDIRPEAVCRYDGWRALFGQTNGQETHLENQGVAAGDIFLFFGLYRQVHKTGERWRFVRNAPRQHIIWGWMQIEQACKVDAIRKDESFNWATYHCHFSWIDDPKNTLYVATRHLDLDDSLTVPGAGVFPRHHERLVLTKPGGSVSQWRLPRWFYPEGNRTPLSCHPRQLWRHDNAHTYVQRKAPGQEFVLDLEEYPEAMDWVTGLLRDCGARQGSAPW